MDAVPEPARTEEWGTAFRLIFQYLAPEERERRCINALYLIQRGEFESAGTFYRARPDRVARRPSMPIGPRMQRASLAAWRGGGTADGTGR